MRPSAPALPPPCPVVQSARLWLGLLLALVGLGGPGCESASFYTQAFKGQYQLFTHQHSIDSLCASPNTPPRLKERFELLAQLRAFAATNLSLPVDGHYRKYVDLHRRFVVWNVEAAPEFSMEPHTWWYPLVGRLSYRGYFTEAGATNYAARLHDKLGDITVGGVTAYSTLGWFKDPVLNTFIFEPDADLAELLFHELGHQQVFARGDTDFNEAFATSVGQEGARRWLQARGDQAAYASYVAELDRTRQFARLILEAHAQLEALYGDERTDEDKIKATDRKRAVPREELRREKQRIFAELKQRYAAAKVRWGGSSEYDGFFNRPLNNADLNSVVAYYDLVPGFEYLIQSHHGNLAEYYRAVQKLADMSRKDRHHWLRTLGSGQPL